MGGHRWRPPPPPPPPPPRRSSWLSGTVVGAINSIPVLPKAMELAGLGYSSWFVYRYVLFKDSRKELVEQFDALKNKVSGEL